jgi:acetyltransferase-like isoleucine patch superfamily enzyme
MVRKIIKTLLFLVSKPLFLKYIGLNYGERCRFINLKPSTFGSEPYLVTLGSHVTVASGVKFITHDGGVWVFRDKYPRIDVISPIVVGSNVFIGLNCILMPGVYIGDNSVIGAGSVVTGSLLGNAVYAGVPARKIRNLEEYENLIKIKGKDTKGLSYTRKKEFIRSQLSNNAEERSKPGYG